MPELAGKITVDLTARKVYIDGTEFPWLIAEDGIHIDGLGQHELRTATLTILADTIEVIPETIDDSDAARA